MAKMRLYTYTYNSRVGLQALSTSSDGTWKSWDLRTSTCLSTMEGSEDKLWALDCSPDGQVVVTGSADSVLTIWKDVTEEKVVEAWGRRKKNLEDEQKLANVVRKGDWTQAIRLAIELDRPFTRKQKFQLSMTWSRS